MQVSVRFLTSSYESRQAGTLILDDDGSTHFETHAHHSEKDVALLLDIHDVLADIVQRADKLPSHDILTMNTEFVKLGSKNIIFHVARHEQCISVFVLSAARRINVLLLGNCHSHFRPGGQHWADYLQSILNTIVQQSQMLAISRLWSKGDQEWSLDAEPAEPSGASSSGTRAQPSGASSSGTRAQPSGASSSGTRAQPSGASSSGTRAQPSGASSSGTRAQPSGASSSGTRAEPSGASSSGTRAEPSGLSWRQQCPNKGRYCINERINDPNRQEKFRNLWEKLLAIETEFQNNGHEFDLEKEKTWPPEVLNIYTKRFPNIAALQEGLLLTHPTNCGEGEQCPSEHCCKIAFRFINFLHQMRNHWKSPKGSRSAPY